MTDFDFGGYDAVLLESSRLRAAGDGNSAADWADFGAVADEFADIAGGPEAAVALRKGVAQTLAGPAAAGMLPTRCAGTGQVWVLVFSLAYGRGPGGSFALEVRPRGRVGVVGDAATRGDGAVGFLAAGVGMQLGNPTIRLFDQPGTTDAGARWLFLRTPGSGAASETPGPGSASETPEAEKTSPP